MFGKKKRYTNDIFGEIEYFATGWRTTAHVSFTLFGKTYAVPVLAVAKKEPQEPINAQQEAVFQALSAQLSGQQAVLEAAILQHVQAVDPQEDYNRHYHADFDLNDLAARLSPYAIEISRQGECAIYVEDNAEAYGEYDEWDEGFVVSLMPEIKVYSKEHYASYIYGGGSL